MSFHSAVHCDIPGCKSRELCDEDQLPKGWTRLSVTDRVISGVEIDICEEHTPANNRLLTLKEMVEAAKLKRDLQR